MLQPCLEHSYTSWDCLWCLPNHDRHSSEWWDPKFQMSWASGILNAGSKIWQFSWIVITSSLCHSHYVSSLSYHRLSTARVLNLPAWFSQVLKLGFNVSQSCRDSGEFQPMLRILRSVRTSWNWGCSFEPIKHRSRSVQLEWLVGLMMFRVISRMPSCQRIRLRVVAAAVAPHGPRVSWLMRIPRCEIRRVTN